MATTLLALGSNLGSPRDNLAAAVRRIDRLAGLSVLRVSDWIASVAIGGDSDSQPEVLNGTLLAKTDYQPLELLGKLQAIENQLGRVRTHRWGPRTIDIDLLLYDELRLQTESLTIPHPWMTVRQFVMRPAVEIAPDLNHPVAQRTLAQLWNQLNLPLNTLSVVGPPCARLWWLAESLAKAAGARLFDPLRQGESSSRPGGRSVEFSAMLAAMSAGFARQIPPVGDHWWISPFSATIVQETCSDRNDQLPNLAHASAAEPKLTVWWCPPLEYIQRHQAEWAARFSWTSAEFASWLHRIDTAIAGRGHGPLVALRSTRRSEFLRESLAAMAASCPATVRPLE